MSIAKETLFVQTDSAIYRLIIKKAMETVWNCVYESAFERIEYEPDILNWHSKLCYLKEKTKQNQFNVRQMQWHKTISSGHKSEALDTGRKCSRLWFHVSLLS